LLHEIMAKGKSGSSKSRTKSTTPPPAPTPSMAPRLRRTTASAKAAAPSPPPVEPVASDGSTTPPEPPVAADAAVTAATEAAPNPVAPEKPRQLAPKLTRTRRTPASKPTAADTAPADAPAEAKAAAPTRPAPKKAATAPKPAAESKPAAAPKPAGARAKRPAPPVPTPALPDPVLQAAPGVESPSLIAAAAEPEGLSILMVASEAIPFAKTGGLADVAAALPVALGRLGHRVRVVIPRYRGIEVSGAPLVSFDLTVGGETWPVAIHETPIGPGASVWLVDIPVLFDREGLYGIGADDHPDNPRRFAALARAALEGALAAGVRPDIIHAHDWQGGLAPVYMKMRYAAHPVLGGVPCVFTIHNIAYTGPCDPRWLPELDLGPELNTSRALEYWGRLSLLKGGLNFSEKITTVSPRYAEEILTPEFAFGFEGVVAARRADLVGILNGVDTETWNPATDPFVPRPYGADDLSGKRDAKAALLRAYGLPFDDAALDTPLIGMVSRMVEQKGLGLIAEAAPELPNVGARFVVLGTGEPRFEQMWRSLAEQFPDRVAVRVGFDESLSHLLEAGSDLFLMPSLFEPCGLNQMYSLRYGTLPLVRATGGLDDTVENFEPSTGAGNGFKFWEPSGAALLATLRWALGVYRAPEVWRRLQRSAMAGDFSWARSAREYVRVYEQALTAAGRPIPATAATAAGRGA
jgi:starch synthase